MELKRQKRSSEIIASRERLLTSLNPESLEAKANKKWLPQLKTQDNAVFVNLCKESAAYFGKIFFQRLFPLTVRILKHSLLERFLNWQAFQEIQKKGF